MKSPTFDIELALRNPSALPKKSEIQLSAAFDLEDRKEQGWGLVARLKNSEGETLEKQLSAMFSGIAGIKNIIRECQPVLRIAINNPNYTCTVLLSSLERFGEIGAQLELSVYPAADQ